MAAPEDQFQWTSVKEQALAGILVTLAAAIAGSICWVAFTVPGKLDHVISNQESFRTTQGEFKTKIYSLEQSIHRQNERIIRLEVR